MAVNDRGHVFFFCPKYVRGLICANRFAKFFCVRTKNAQCYYRDCVDTFTCCLLVSAQTIDPSGTEKEKYYQQLKKKKLRTDLQHP